MKQGYDNNVRFDRKFAEQQAKDIMLKQDKRRMEEAKHILENKQGLAEAIEEKIFPCVVSTLNNIGIIGTGFFYHSKWLVSNAHVIPSYEALTNTELVDYKLNINPIYVEKAYHRPYQKEKSPDIVVVNVKDHNNINEKCLSSTTQFNDKKVHYNSITFYVYFNHDTYNFEIKYLTPNRTDRLPFFYNCEDNTDPQLGCSGALVIGAYISITGHELEWQFYMIGTLYARCILDQFSSKLACVIPIKQDFDQLLNDIIYPRQLAERCELMGQASTHIRDGESRANKYYTYEQEYKEKAERGLQLFEAGKTILDIDLPDGLERLTKLGVNTVRERALLEIERKKKEKEHFCFEHEGKKYYYFPDRHGNKHTEFSNKIKANTLRHWPPERPATFNASFAKRYVELIKEVIRQAIPQSSNFVRFRNFVGWDNGEETNVVELYYEGNLGSHIRPKAVSQLIADVKIIDFQTHQTEANMLAPTITQQLDRSQRYELFHNSKSKRDKSLCQSINREEDCEEDFGTTNASQEAMELDEDDTNLTKAIKASLSSGPPF